MHSNSRKETIPHAGAPTSRNFDNSAARPAHHFRSIPPQHQVIAISLGIMVFICSLAYLFVAIRNNWGSLSIRLHHIRFYCIVPATALLLAAYVFAPMLWRYILRRIGFNLQRMKSVGIFYLSSLALYLPVKTLDLVGRVMLLKRTGCSIESGAHSVFYEAWLSLAASIMLALYFPAIQFSRRAPGSAPLGAMAWLISALCVGLLAVFLIKTAFRLVRPFFKNSMHELHPLPTKTLFAILANFVLIRVVTGLAFYLCLGSIIQFDSINIYEAVSVQSLSWIGSLLAFFIPKGLAVREAIVVSALAPSIGAAAAITAALIFRLLSIILDLAFGLSGLFIFRETMASVATEQKKDAQSAEPPQGRRLLSIVADDFGASAEIDERILSCLRMGIVTDISVIVNQSDAALEGTVGRLKDSGAASIGLHLCLHSGSTFPIFPVSATSEIRELTASDGTFRQLDMLSFFKPWSDRALDAAEAEMRAQIERYRATGLPLHFVNSHRNSFMNWSLFNRAASVAAEYGIPYLRVINEAAGGFPRFSKRSAFLFAMRGSTARCMRVAEAQGISHADHFLGFIENMRLSAGQFENMLFRLQPGLTELAVHLIHDDHVFCGFSKPEAIDILFASRGVQRLPLCMAKGYI